MLKLVKFCCGCVGTEPVDGKTQIVYADESYGAGCCLDVAATDHRARPIPGEPEYQVLVPQSEEYKRIVGELSLLIQQGKRYRAIREALIG